MIKNVLVVLFLLTGFALQAQIIYVDVQATGNNDGTSWADAFTDLQDGLDAISPTAMQIWVAQGTYLPSQDNPASSNTTSRDFTFYMATNGTKLYGGFNGTETTLAQRDIAAFPTILSGDIGIPNENSDNVFHVVYINGGTANGNITNATVLDGFTIQAGNADAAATSVNNRGDGIFADGNGGSNVCNPRVANCSFVNNGAASQHSRA
ncbi:MAG: hypothetical protein AAF806_30220 [Bacteroidota bacterium]